MAGRDGNDEIGVWEIYEDTERRRGMESAFDQKSVIDRERWQVGRDELCGIQKDVKTKTDRCDCNVPWNRISCFNKKSRILCRTTCTIIAGLTKTVWLDNHRVMNRTWIWTICKEARKTSSLKISLFNGSIPDTRTMP